MCTLHLLGMAASVKAQPYFQQRVDHVIEVRLDDASHTLHAHERFTYTNNSPVALDTLWLHLWPNAYRDRNSALCRQLEQMGQMGLHFATEEERGRIDSLAFTATYDADDSRADQLTWGYHPRHADIAWLKLGRPLGSGERVIIATPFRVKIPDGSFSRLGRTGQAYYITQWFPKPAVFDKDGWHAMPYLSQGEFYSEFGSYDVSITLPANYVVGATGVLQNKEERELMDRMASPEWKYPEVPKDPRTGKPQHDRFPASSAEMKTLRFVQDNVHDFAWFADKRFIVRKGGVTLPASGRKVTTWALYTARNAKTWDAMGIESLEQSVLRYSQWVGEYPYEACTAVDGTISAGAGMEYPMITIIGSMGTTESLDEVIAHEVGHNWFYGILASNERDHPWMDEGMNSFVELRYMRARHPDSEAGVGLPGERYLTGRVSDPHHFRNELTCRLNTRRNLDQPSGLGSTDLTAVNYGAMVYGKTALAMDHLLAYLGDTLFDRCMHAYFDEWKFKHPRPEDLRNVFERESGKDLGWVFDGLIGTDRKVDVKAIALKPDRTFRLKSTGLDGIPVPVTALKGTDTLGTRWFTATGKATSHYLPWPDADRIRIDASARTLDIDRRNNGVRGHGLFRRCATPGLKWLAGVEKDDRRSVYWTPAVGYNAHDGWMPGLVLHNTTFPNQRLEWVAAPLFGTQSQRLAGGARVMWHHDRLRSDLFSNIHVGVSGFAASLWNVGDVEQWYQRIAPEIGLDLRGGPHAAATDIRLRTVLLRDMARGEFRSGDATRSIDLTEENAFHEVRLRHARRNGLHPFDLQLTSLNHQAFNRISLDARWSALYDRQRHRVTLRGFGGMFLRTDDATMQAPFGWRMHWGSSDLLRDHLFFERQYLGQNTAQQFAKDQGGFKTPTANGTSDTWIAALNMEADFPFKLPLSLFASYGAAPFTQVDQNGMRKDWRGYWEMGLGVRVVRDLVEVWVPLAYSNEIRDEVETLRGMDFTERIRFVFALERMDPTQALRKAPH